MFKLLALRVLDGCANHIKKCLHTNVYYYFCNDFRFEIPGKIYRGSKYTHPLPEDFFSLPARDSFMETKATPTININAIVGKNGDGKSTIVEIIMRMVNNYVALNQQNGQAYTMGRNLLTVDKVYAELYFQIDSGIYKLIIKDAEHYEKKIADITNSQVLNIIEKDTTKDIFASIYTLVSNYSHYAYNIHDFLKEWNLSMPWNTEDEQNEACWLYHIFHKNDGYATPISLHPYRKSGNIDINKETYLSKQRLLMLFINSDNKKNSFRKILDETAVEIKLKTNKSSKLHERTLIDYFKWSEQDDISLEWVTAYINKSINTIEASPERTEIELEYLSDNYFNEVTYAFEYIINGKNEDKNYSDHYKTYMDHAIKWLDKTFLTHPEYLRDSQKRSNIETYIMQINKLRTFARKKELGVYLPRKKELKQYKKYERYNIKQLARLRTIYDIAIRQGFEPLVCFKQKNLSSIEKCQQYEIYKIISIFETYPKYTELYKKRNDKYLGSGCIEFPQSIFDELYNLLEYDIKNRSHITRKLKQTQNYIDDCNKYNGQDFYRSLEKKQDDKSNDTCIISLDDIKSYYEKNGGLSLENLPPAIFDTEIIFETRGTKIDMSSLSSGEKQFINTIGAIIYHMQNINSNQNYSSINLFLEEIELYFHPDYQRQFILRLIQQIHSANLTNIKNINITFVTHSPFVLSDIPKCNVLFLKEGQPDYGMQDNTFGANIHSILKNGFFLPNLPMGEFAYQKINEWFGQFSENEFDKTEESIARLREEIAIVGEPYLREQLYKSLKSQVP